LEGLEIAEVNLSKLERTKRIDAEFFRKEFIRNQEALMKSASVPISELVAVSDGNHFSISDDFIDDGIPYYRGQDTTGQFFAEQSSPIGITREAFEHPHMRRSHLKKGDVLLSIVGTVGSLALVGSNREATCSCKLAIFRPKSIESEFLAIYLASKPGAAQIQRFRRGTVQTGFLLEDTDQIFIPQLSKKFTKAIVSKVGAARAALESAGTLQQQAEKAVLSALDLAEWRVPDPLTYECGIRAVFESGRMDAEFFRTKFDALRNKIAEVSDLVSLGDIALVTNGKTVPYDEDGSVPIVRSGDLSDISSHENLLRAKPSEDIFYLKKGDVLISSIGFGSIGKVQVFDLDIPCGAVSEVTVIRTDKVNPYFLCSYLRSIAGQLQFERWTTGATGQLHLYPRDVRLMFVPLVSSIIQLEIESFFKDGAESRAHSKSLLERAKRAVEIAIEESEETALAYLDGKHYLADELLPKLFGPNRHYIDLATVQRTIEAEALVYEDATINRYLHEWTREGRIHDAGRGWYSNLPHALNPNQETPPLPELEKLLKKKFPLLEFTVWSTRQLTTFFHHYAARHATFLMVDRDAIDTVADVLSKAGHHVAIHPLGEAAKNFALTQDETIILRPRLSSDHKETFAPIEQMLVDFYHEIQKLGLFDLAEFQSVFGNLANRYRLNIPALKRYAERRKMDSNELLKLGGIT
jgi:hypothetical protein